MKTRWLILSLILSLFIFTGCGSDENNNENNANSANNTENQNNNAEEADEPEESAGKFEDGLYFAQEDEFGGSGWKNIVTLEVENGDIVNVDWNAAHKEGGVDKKESSKTGEYGMVAKGGAIAEWHEQAELTEQYLLET